MRIVGPQNQTQLRGMLAVLLDRPGLTPAEVDESVEVLFNYASRRGLSLEECISVCEGSRTLSACLCIDSPGHMTSMFLPSRAEYLEPTIAATLLIEASRRASQRGIRYIQAMTDPDAVTEAEVYRQAEFQYVTCLLYMERDPTLPLCLEREPPPVDWQTYAPQRRTTFGEVLQATYDGSLDCVAMNGIRDIEDILASHQAAGEFDAGRWFLGYVGRDPIGVLLLSRIPDRWAHEVVYMGLLPGWRGRGYGVTLLRHAILVAREAGDVALTLTVDEGNQPACRLYERFSFAQTGRRNVWLRVLAKSERTL